MTTMAASARTRARGRVLPKGWPDFLLQLFLFALVDLAYESSRMLATGDVATAFVHARDVVSVEQTFGFFNEISVQRFALDHPHILDVANLTYFHAHFGVTTVFMFWLYLRRNDYYYFIRNIVFASMAIALAGYMLYPTAPPRMLTDLGFTDTLEKFASINHDSGAVLSLSNPVRRRPQRAHLLLADHRAVVLLPGEVATAGHRVAVLPGADHLLDRRHGKPLLAGRDPRRRRRGDRVPDRPGGRAGAPDAAGLGPPAPADRPVGPRPRGVSASSPFAREPYTR